VNPLLDHHRTTATKAAREEDLDWISRGKRSGECMRGCASFVIDLIGDRG
jgi:hypothetical protein